MSDTKPLPVLKSISCSRCLKTSNWNGNEQMLLVQQPPILLQMGQVHIVHCNDSKRSETHSNPWILFGWYLIEKRLRECHLNSHLPRVDKMEAIFTKKNCKFPRHLESSNNPTSKISNATCSNPWEEIPRLAPNIVTARNVKTYFAWKIRSPSPGHLQDTITVHQAIWVFTKYPKIFVRFEKPATQSSHLDGDWSHG